MRACNSSSRHNRIAFAIATVTLGWATLTLTNVTSAQSSKTLASASGDHQISQSIERMDLIVKSSRVISLGDRIPRFQVHNEEVLGATPISENQIQVFGKNPGTTQVNLWDTDEKLYTIDVTVVADAREIEGILNTHLPLASLRVTPLGESAILSGYVYSVDDVDRAVAIAEQFYTNVVNSIEVVGVQQVLLHTRIMEVSRTKLRKLGIDLAILDDNFNLLNAPGQSLNVGAGLSSSDGGIGASLSGAENNNLRFSLDGNFEGFLDALEADRLVKLLAEPTVVATHGRPARFTVGGRVPTLIPGQNGQVQVQYEDYGTSIDFLPFVIGPGRIRLEVRPEVSEPDPARSITVAGTNVSAFTTRYVETAVEMQAGQTFALAGLLQSRTDSSARRTPLLGSIPYIGTFFRKMREETNQIELLIMITPELVEAMDPHEVPRGGPGLNSTSPDSKEFYAYGHIEVPNLKSDLCDDENSQTGITGMLESSTMDSRPVFNQPPVYDSAPINHPQSMQGGAMQGGAMQGGAMQGGAMQGGAMQGEIIEPNPMLNAPHASNMRRGQRVQGYGGPGLIDAPTQPVRTARARPSTNYEAGKLLPPNAIVPGSQPKVIGEGVMISQPSLR